MLDLELKPISKLYGELVTPMLEQTSVFLEPQSLETTVSGVSLQNNPLRSF